MRKAAVISLVILAVMSGHQLSAASDCDFDRGPCIAMTGKTEVILDISPRPVRTMKELLFVATVKGADIRAPLLLDLSMPGMYMGRNEVTLKKRPDGSFSGKGVIPRCPSGGKLWQAEVTVPGAGKLTFRFHVDN